MNDLIQKQQERFDEKFYNNEADNSNNWLYDMQNGDDCGDDIKSLMLQNAREIVEEMIKWVEDRLAKCEKLKTSEYITETPEYFEGKIAILNDLLSKLNNDLSELNK